MSSPVEFIEILRRDGHIRDSGARLTPLNGGVSSEIYLVEDGAEKFVVKRALAKLKVKDNWFADVSRNVSERNYFEYVGEFMPGSVPQLRFSDSKADYFGMEFLGEGFANWKQLLLDADCRISHAETAGTLIGKIHRRTRFKDALRQQFDTTANFRQLRLDPYLLTTGARHPELQEMFVAEALRIESTRESLVHGDFSPKNILIREDRMVLIDGEVAWYGDPAFDLGFFLTHLFLKSLYHLPRKVGIAEMISAFWRAYCMDSGEAILIEKRIVPLLLMLLLARVDGKSPVEYLTPLKQRFVRNFVQEHLPSPPQRLAQLNEIWFRDLSDPESILAAR
ncbi:MAG: phosphotransferase [Terriglobales bacterium]